MSAADVRYRLFIRAGGLAATEPIQYSAFLVLLRRAALPTQSFQLPFEILQFRDSRANMRNVLIEQAVGLLTILPGKVPNT